MPHLAALLETEVDAVHHATLRILDEVGILLTQPQAREALAGAGARLHEGRVRIPAALVEQSLARCPDRVCLRGRDGHVVELGDGSLQWHNLGGASHVYDHRTGQRRPAVIRDVQDATRLLDALDGATTATPFFTPHDVPGPLMSLSMYRHALSHTTKPLHGPGAQTAGEVRFLARMAAVVGPPADVLTMGISPISPLFFPDDVAAAIVETATLGLPFGPLPCPTAGATAPLSMAGALAQQNAEVLAAIVLAQHVRPGLPILYCGRLAMMEPRTGLSVWGGVELGLLSAATVQLAHGYGLPANVYGLSTNAHTLDLQSGYERAINAAIPALAGADELSGIGEMAAGVTGSYAQMVVDSEIAGSIHRLRRGFAVDGDSLAVDVIRAAMAGSRNFLDQKHTVRYLRAGEVFATSLADRSAWEEFSSGGRITIADRAQAEADRLLAEHHVPALTPEQERELDDIMLHAERELVVP